MKEGFDHQVFFQEVFAVPQVFSGQEELFVVVGVHEMIFPVGLVKELHLPFLQVRLIHLVPGAKGHIQYVSAGETLQPGADKSSSLARLYMLETSVIITILGAFLLVLICIELLDTIKAYFYENTIHVEIVILLAIIAISRKVILLDPSGMSGIEFGVEMMGIGVIVIFLAAGYYFLKKAGISGGSGKPDQK